MELEAGGIDEEDGKADDEDEEAPVRGFFLGAASASAPGAVWVAEALASSSRP